MSATNLIFIFCDDTPPSKTQTLYDRLLEIQGDRGEGFASQFKDLWNAGGLNEDLEGLTRRIARVRSRWQASTVTFHFRISNSTVPSRIGLTPMHSHLLAERAREYSTDLTSKPGQSRMEIYQCLRP